MSKTRVGRIVLGVVALAGVAATARLVAADAPPGQYMIANDGTVYDTKTQLTWQKYPPFQSAPEFTWAGAQAYCANPGLPGAGWRVPSVTELETLVDESKMFFSIDNTFNDSFKSEQWTSTPVASSPGFAWRVSFQTGDAYVKLVQSHLGVRCVR